jgi:hypothetical protein
MATINNLHKNLEDIELNDANSFNTDVIGTLASLDEKRSSMKLLLEHEKGKKRTCKQESTKSTSNNSLHKKNDVNDVYYDDDDIDDEKWKAGDVLLIDKVKKDIEDGLKRSAKYYNYSTLIENKFFIYDANQRHNLEISLIIISICMVVSVLIYNSILGAVYTNLDYVMILLLIFNMTTQSILGNKIETLLNFGRFYSRKNTINTFVYLICSTILTILLNYGCGLYTYAVLLRIPLTIMNILCHFIQYSNHRNIMKFVEGVSFHLYTFNKIIFLIIFFLLMLL